MHTGKGLMLKKHDYRNVAEFFPGLRRRKIHKHIEGIEGSLEDTPLKQNFPAPCEGDAERDERGRQKRAKEVTQDHLIFVKSLKRETYLQQTKHKLHIIFFLWLKTRGWS